MMEFKSNDLNLPLPILKPAFSNNKGIAVLEMAFRTPNVFGTFQKRAQDLCSLYPPNFILVPRAHDPSQIESSGTSEICAVAVKVHFCNRWQPLLFQTFEFA